MHVPVMLSDVKPRCLVCEGMCCAEAASEKMNASSSLPMLDPVN